MGTIIVGFDGSSSAQEAVRWAVREGQLRDWSVTALLAWTYLNQPHLPSEEPFKPTFTAADAAAALDRMLVRDLPDLVIDVDQRVVCDLPSQALIDASADADLLVVGARGLGGFKSALLGSVSQQCVHHSKCPVAVVRTPPRAGEERVVVAIDGSPDADRALDWALDEARARSCPVAVVHAWQLPMYATVEIAPPGPDLATFQAEAGDVVDDALGRADTRGLPADAIERRVVMGGAAQAALDASRDASLLVVGSRGRGGFAGLLLGSVSQHLVHHATCPIVVVPHHRR